LFQIRQRWTPPRESCAESTQTIVKSVILEQVYPNIFYQYGIV
jgi:hypothetical protein